MMFLTGDYTDILKIELKDMTVFASCPEGNGRILVPGIRNES